MHNFRFILKPRSDGLLPSFTGQLVKEAVLKTMKKYDKQLYKQLQKEKKNLPYSLSTLHSYKKSLNRTEKGEIIIKEDSTYTFRLGILTNELAEEMEKLTQEKNKLILQIGEIDFQVVAVEIHRKSTQEFLLHSKKDLDNLILEFYTIVYFTIPGQEAPLLFPEPGYLFKDLVQLWNNFTEDKVFAVPSEFSDWLGEHIVVGAYDLRTRKAYVEKNKLKVGFKGWVQYKLTGEDKWKIWAHTLAQFAKFSNVGENRSSGLGNVKYSFKKKSN